MRARSAHSSAMRFALLLTIDVALAAPSWTEEQIAVHRPSTIEQVSTSRGRRADATVAARMSGHARHTAFKPSVDLPRYCPGEPIGQGCERVIYTVIIGQQSKVQPPLGGFTPGCAIMITDLPSNARNGWSLHRTACLDGTGYQADKAHGRMVSRWWKINSHRFFQMPSIYFDAKNPLAAADKASAWERSYGRIHRDVLVPCGASFGAFEHLHFPAALESELQGILHPVHAVRTRTKQACQTQLDMLLADTAFRGSARVIDGSFLVRQPVAERLAEIEKAWWHTYVTSGCDRDQPAFARAIFSLYGNQSSQCGANVRILAWRGRGAKRGPWSDVTPYCHPNAKQCQVKLDAAAAAPRRQ